MSAVLLHRDTVFVFSKELQTLFRFLMFTCELWYYYLSMCLIIMVLKQHLVPHLITASLESGH